jgi:hypothetical protein
MVRLDALQVPTFRVTMYGGSLFRASISAVPFLLPLLFQVGFGMDPFPFRAAGAGGVCRQFNH